MKVVDCFINIGLFFWFTFWCIVYTLFYLLAVVGLLLGVILALPSFYILYYEQGRKDAHRFEQKNDL